MPSAYKKYSLECAPICFLVFAFYLAIQAGACTQFDALMGDLWMENVLHAADCDAALATRAYK